MCVRKYSGNDVMKESDPTEAQRRGKGNNGSSQVQYLRGSNLCPLRTAEDAIEAVDRSYCFLGHESPVELKFGA